MVRLCGDVRALALIPLYLYSNWCYTYQFNIFNGELFTLPTKFMNNAFYWGAQIIAPLMMSVYLDSDRPAKTKAYVSFVAITAFVALTWAAGAVHTTTIIWVDGTKVRPKWTRSISETW